MEEDKTEDLEDDAIDAEEEEPSEPSLRESLETAIDEAEDAPEDELEADTDIQDSEEVEDVPSEEESIEYPSSWSSEIREKMAEMPKEFQKWASEYTGSQQATFTRNMQELARVRKNFEGVASVIQPYERSLKEAGETPEQRIGYLLEVDRALFEGDPQEARQTLLQLCQDAEINPGDLLQGNGQHSSYSDPRVANLEAEISRLREEAGQYTKFVQSEQERRKQEQVQSVTATIEDFAQAKGEDGSLLRPYFQDLQDDMASIAAGIKGQFPQMSHVDVLKKAYDIAVSENPTIQARIQKDRARSESSKKVEEAKRKASKARKAGSSVSGSPGSSTKPIAPKTIRDALEASM